MNWRWQQDRSITAEEEDGMIEKFSDLSMGGGGGITNSKDILVSHHIYDIIYSSTYS